MATQAASPTSTSQLRRNALGLPQVVFQGITHIAPSINVVFTFPVIALKAGPDMPISFLLTTIVCFFIANTVSQFSKYMPSSGGYYSFATRGLGARTGFMTTWSYLIYDIIGPAGAIGFLGYLASSTFQMASGVNIPWWIFALITFAIVWVLTHFGIRLSMRTTAIFGGIEMLIMLALAFTFLAHPGHGSSFSAPLLPKNAPNHYEGILAGMVFSILALSGFEAPAPLAQETKRPGKFIGRAVMLSLVLIGIFYIFTSYTSAIGWGTGNMAAFASNANPYYALGHSLWGVGWWFIFIAIVNSAIGCGLACTNAASRVAYTMGQAGTLPARFGKIHPVHRTPTFAIAVQQIIGIVAILLVGTLLAPDTIFGFLGTITTLAVIVLYIMANIALTAYIRREHAADYNPWRHLILPGIGTLALLPVLWITVYPVPPWPYRITPYIFVAALLVGFGYMQWRERRNPGALKRGATMLVGRPADAEGDVDWDSPAAPAAQADA
ncbi:MAG TPA: APC family permease [Streptosporangiaceae bacterium]|jgi:amino acid transporter|nr:APC family permease [Streptosporangiaceae bacterium]